MYTYVIRFAGLKFKDPGIAVVFEQYCKSYGDLEISTPVAESHLIYLLIIYFVAVFINCIAYFIRVRFDVKLRLLEKTVLIVYVISLAVMLLEPLIFFDRFWKFVILVSVAIIIATLGIEPVDKNKHGQLFYVVWLSTQHFSIYSCFSLKNLYFISI